MLANASLVSSLGLLASSVLAVQAVGSMGQGMGHWLRLSETELQARVAAAPLAPATPPELPGASQQVERAADGMFYLSAKADTGQIRFLIDTGSTATILTRSDAARLGLEEQAEGSRRARTLAGEVRITHARIGELRIAGRRFADVRVGVASDDLGVSLIGQDVLSRFESIVFEKDRASLR
ncbi:retropepsin-like aspartic protease [Sphingomonas sp. dw_22]|uniref:retropepsin-like aspartic protease family protein n=1 Tax=Sphingomonas sp. dw_22 TaxID=2721175 RepID=UPI001BD4D2E7|nr:retropepsin-like aspartic protease [Sphingomonas sp. dw_22]